VSSTSLSLPPIHSPYSIFGNPHLQNTSLLLPTEKSLKRKVIHCTELEQIPEPENQFPEIMEREK
jgi:hypothetical protein